MTRRDALTATAALALTGPATPAPAAAAETDASTVARIVRTVPAERLDGTDEVNLQLRAGTGGLHSAEN